MPKELNNDGYIDPNPWDIDDDIPFPYINEDNHQQRLELQPTHTKHGNKIYMSPENTEDAFDPIPEVVKLIKPYSMNLYNAVSESFLQFDYKTTKAMIDYVRNLSTSTQTQEDTFLDILEKYPKIGWMHNPDVKDTFLNSLEAGTPLKELLN